MEVRQSNLNNDFSVRYLWPYNRYAQEPVSCPPPSGPKKNIPAVFLKHLFIHPVNFCSHLIGWHVIEFIGHHIYEVSNIINYSITHTFFSNKNSVVIVRSEEHTSELQSRQYLVC